MRQPFFVLVFVCAACTGGSDTGTTQGGSSSGSTSSGGSSSSSSSGGSSSGSTSGCTALHIGGTNDPALGGGATSQVVAQAVSDVGGVTAKQVDDLTASCKAIATALDAPPAEQAAADATTDANEKMKAWCQLATSTLGTSKAQAGGAMSVQYTPVSCKLSVATKAACQGRCMGSTSPCDTTANPMTCAGGTLSNGTCEGGKLEGGCAVEAKCDTGCDATTDAAADCPAPAVTVTISGASDAAEAAKLKAAIEANLPTIAALKAHCALEADVAASLTGTVSSVTDVEAACIPPLLTAAVKESKDISACASASASVASAAQ